MSRHATLDKAKPTAGRRTSRHVLGYAALVGVPVVLVILALRLLEPGHPAGGGAGFTQQPGAVSPNVFTGLIVAVPVILIACYAVARMLRPIGQPKVVGDILAGVLLGPSFLGLLWPDVFHWLFPSELVAVVNVLAQLGLIFFMFLVGRDLEPGYLRDRGGAIALVAHAGFAIPFLVGMLLAGPMYATFGSDGTSFTTFALFLAVSMSITAVPVLARIIEAHGLRSTPLGSMVMASSVVCDVTAWCVLAFVVAAARSASPGDAVLTVLLTVAFVVFMVAVVRPVLGRLLRDGRRSIPDAAHLPVLLSAIMICALITEEIGIHAIFGAFLLGVVVPRDSERVQRATVSMEGTTTTLLLPLFFVVTGLRTSIGALDDLRTWLWCLAVTLIAIGAKWVSTMTAGRLAGYDWWQSMSMGALMSCRGLTELIVLNIALDLGVITSTVFTMLVIMALVSTMLTSPALTLIRRRSKRARVRSAGRPFDGTRGPDHG
ncbi:cation:proton antiporter [Streptomyces sp. NPDC058001]|uniref:cation:proton antiporter domain-containing protein n=1 Tax=Streptomyces sp. NPDC058001 TaxID=3346300 RepID=UPI0036E356A1